MKTEAHLSILRIPDWTMGMIALVSTSVMVLEQRGNPRKIALQKRT